MPLSRGSSHKNELMDVKPLCRIAMICLLSMTSACAQAGFALINVPSRLGDMVELSGLAYGTEPSQQLNIYRPAGSEGQNLDVIVFFYGGRWTFGDKDDYRFVGKTFTDRNFIVVIPDVRKYPAVRFPVFIQDGAKALAWVHDNIARYHGNPARIHVAGHSSGAHIGALLAADPRYLADEGKDRSSLILDFAGLASPYAFTPDEPDLIEMFGPPANYPAMQATTFIDGRQPPMLLLYGDADDTVRIANLEKLVARIRTTGGTVHAEIYRNIGHVGIASALSWFNPSRVPVVDDMVRFFRLPGRHAGK